MLIENIKAVHLMGVGGAGMSALAKLLKAKGLEVSGCDLQQPHYDLEDTLVSPCIIGHSPEHINKFKPQALILSSAVSHENPEVLKAKESGLRIYSRAQALSDLFNNAQGIGIAGAHGKTTTTSMTGLIFLQAGLDPTIYVGANVPDIGSNAISGHGQEKYFIAELDESDGTFELFHPSIAIITNADWDHVDHYKTRGEVIQAFTRFADGRKNYLIMCAEDEGTSQVYANCSKREKILRYGWGKSFDWGAYDIINNPGGGISCKVSHNGQELGRLELAVSGEHNILNALAATAAADLCGVGFETSSEILRQFHGSERRMQVKGTRGDILVMDDYAHHPSEIKATLKAVRGIYPDKRIVVVYQPHRFSRTAKFAPDIARALNLADEIFLLPVYSAGEKELSHSSSDEIIRLSGKAITPINKLDDALDAIKPSLRSGDLLLTMGAGNVYEIGENFLAE
ncbi:MAG: UDP-N-acetylmuramate--L-alanine ligase [Synergistaceae bacterium]|nr:UDP-N-acetylmuramate--L-alanine ligase [Synergistaceae bacterium]